MGDVFYGFLPMNRGSARQLQLETLRDALAYVRNWSVAIDGGAYIGDWSAVMAEKFETVHAFEPAAVEIDALQSRFVNSNVVVHHAALWKETARVSLVPDPLHPMKAFGRHVRPRPAGDPPGDNIEAVAIDDLSLESCGLIKLDLEGAEMFALSGARQTIVRCRPVVICECKPQAAWFNASPDDPWRFLSGLGYREALRRKPDRVFVP